MNNLRTETITYKIIQDLLAERVS